MKKTLSWKILIPVGLILHFTAYLSDNVIILGLGILGDLMFIFGIINLVTGLIRRNKNTS